MVGEILTLHAIERPHERLLTYYVLKSLAALPAAPLLLVYLYFRYHSMRYQFEQEGLRMSWGILFRQEIVLNYARIQDIHLRSNVVERWLGLARIEIQTASGSAGIAGRPVGRDGGGVARGAIGTGTGQRCVKGCFTGSAHGYVCRPSRSRPPERRIRCGCSAPGLTTISGP